MTTFEPNPQFVVQMEQLLAAASSGQEQARGALAQLESLQSHPDYFRYCAYILSCPVTATGADPITMRQLAAFQIKNGISRPNCRNALEVKNLTFSALTDPQRRIRKAAGGILASAVSRGVWNPRTVVSELLDGLSDHPGVLAALLEVIEENIEPLDFEDEGLPAVTRAIAPAIIPMLGSSDLETQREALGIVDVLLEQAALRREGPCFEALKEFVDKLLQYLAYLISVPSCPPKLLALSIQCLYYLFAYSDDIGHLVPSMTDAVVSLAGHASEDVRIEVVMYFAAALDSQMIHRVDSYVPQVLQYLMGCLIYSDMELEMLCATENDGAEPDKPEDVRPKNFQLRARRATEANDEEDDDADDDVEQWNLRKAAGQTLYEFARHMGDAILEHVLPVISERLTNAADWKQQESALLAIGAVSGNCEGLHEHLPVILNHIFQTMSSPQTHFLVACMCCWALETNAEWILTSSESQQGGFAGQTFACVLSCMTSRTKILQTRATSALGSFANAAAHGELLPYATQILTTVNECFHRYQLKNLYVLFENVDSVYRNLGRSLAEGELLQLATAPLQALWKNVSNDSPLVFPFFMALSSACEAIGAAIEPMAPEIFSRSLTLIEHHQLARLYAASAKEDMPDQSNEFLNAGLDLLSGLVNALQAGIVAFVHEAGEQRVLQLLINGCSDPAPEVRQSAFGLLAEFSAACIGFIQSNWQLFAPAIYNGLGELEHYAVASNAAWCLSQILSNYVDDGTLQPGHAANFMLRLASMLSVPFEADMRLMRENAAIAIGGILALYPQASAQPNIEDWVPGWIQSLSNMSNCPQREAALRSVLHVWIKEPSVVVPSLKSFLDLMTSLPPEMPHDLRNQLAEFINVIKQGLGSAAWNSGISTYNPRLRDKLRVVYGVQ